MKARQIAEGLYQIPIMNMVNVYLIDGGADGLILVDTGVEGSEQSILDEIRALGRQPQDLKAILVTHLHGDHTGSLAALVRETGAQVYMHAAEATLVRQGIGGRPTHPAPGLLNKLLFKLVMEKRAGGDKIPAASTDHAVTDADRLPLAGGITVIHTPGHTAGHVAYLWERAGGVLFAGDALSHMTRLGYSPIYEDFDLAKQSIRRLAGLEFKMMCLGHGKPLMDATVRLRQAKIG